MGFLRRRSLLRIVPIGVVNVLALYSFVRIPTKKIAHSELKTIRSSPSDAVKNILWQVIVISQE